MVVVLTLIASALALLALVAIAMGVIGIVRANAHDALPTAAKPLGWKYPYNCCSDVDCRQVKAKVQETPQGYVVPSGEVIAMSDTRIKESPDGLFHICTVAGEETSRTICLFVPPRGM